MLPLHAMLVLAQVGCNNTCSTANNGVCDYTSDLCEQGTDCADCTASTSTDWNQIILIASAGVGGVALLAIAGLCVYDIQLRRKIKAARAQPDAEQPVPVPTRPAARPVRPAQPAQPQPAKPAKPQPAQPQPAKPQPTKPVRPVPVPAPPAQPAQQAIGQPVRPTQPTTDPSQPAESRMYNIASFLPSLELRSGAASTA